MVGVPDSDLISWQVRRSERMAQHTSRASHGMPSQSKRPRIEKGPIPADHLRAQLEAHKALMSGATTTSAPPHITQPAISATPPPPPPPPSMPSVSAQGIQAPEAPPTHKPTAQRGEKVRLVYTDTILCPEENMASLPKYAYVEPVL